ncbi:MAG: phosphoglyceromutase [Bacteroidetes bacterium]|jgi:hypothetical protein|nr:phosphoglyceromutase [Bacteroidota bacterium]
MKKILLLVGIIFTAIVLGHSQYKTEKIVFITMDGLRWQDLYTGADSILIRHKDYVEHPDVLVDKFWNRDPLVRREKLMPFFWNTIAKHGQLYGNRKHGSKVDLANPYWFSYPGYNEILTGIIGDTVINSNNKIPNPYTTVLEVINNTSMHSGKVAAFGSWDVFPYIINEERSGIPVNAGFEPVTGNDLTEKEKFLNELQTQIPSPWHTVRLDAFTHHYAMEHLKKYQPDLLYVAYGETDDFGHDGRYDHYLNSAYTTDQFIKAIWEWVQSNPDYKNKTTLIIATDHGRGTNGIDAWRSHGVEWTNSDESWFAIMGPDVEAKGEIKHACQYYNSQYAATIAELMGVPYTQDKKMGEALDILKK